MEHQSTHEAHKSDLTLQLLPIVYIIFFLSISEAFVLKVPKVNTMYTRPFNCVIINTCTVRVSIFNGKSDG